MRKKLIITNSLILFLSLIILSVASCGIIYKQNYDAYKMQAQNYLDLTISIFDGTNFEHTAKALKDIQGDVRLTIISNKDNEVGKVVLDTNNENIFDNHSDRPELKELNKIFTRYSITEKKRMMYIADIDSSGYFIRISLAMGNIDSIISSYLMISVLTLSIIGVVSIVLVFMASKKSLKPINNTVNQLSKLTGKSTNYKESTIDDLPLILSDISKVLNDYIEEIDRQRKEIISVFDLLNQGVVVLDKDGNTKLLNKVAYVIFNESQDILNKNFIYLFRNVDLQNIIKDALNEHQSKVFELMLDGRIYNVLISFVIDTWLKGGLIITFNDVTIKRNLEITKRDFFQNASHELKSPLTSIIGYQQMIANDIVDEYDQMKDISSKTLKEATRMNNIIIDMLNLAVIEQNYEKHDEFIRVDEMITDIIESLNSSLNKRHITVKLNLHNEVISCDPKLLDELIRNLIDNAIKYNKDNGNIDISLNKGQLKISDSGIGIEETNIPRIFERFYRVDKGRSKDSGGTGLGLAIVKHICELYNYSIIVKSKYGYGTEIVVKFQ